MTDDARIARAYPQLTEPQARVALLGETLAMVREMTAARQEFEAAGNDETKVAAIVARSGLAEEIGAAEKVATATIVDLIARASERDLEEGRDKGLLSPEDFREAITAKRTMELARRRSPEADRDHERD